jgi:membrane-associated protease RseP (regulator of RpoE activity)
VEIVLAIILTLFAITFHELGHAYAMWKRKVPIKRISLIGVPFPLIPFLRFTVRLRPDHEPTRLEAHPLVIGAFVEPKEEALKELSAKDRALIYGAGPHASMLYTLVMFSIANLLSGTFEWMIVWTLCAIMLCAFYQPACRYLVPLAGVYILYLIARLFLLEPQIAAENIGGPVAIYEFGAATFERHHANYASAFTVAGYVSYFLATTNMLPFVPLDGGQIVRTYISALKPELNRYYVAGSLVLFLGLIGLALTNDFGTLFR